MELRDKAEPSEGVGMSLNMRGVGLQQVESFFVSNGWQLAICNGLDHVEWRGDMNVNELLTHQGIGNQ